MAGDVNKIRNDVCSHIDDHQEHYKPYVMKGVQTDKDFQDYLQEMKSPGVWNTDLADCLPLAIANQYKIRLRIFSSDISASVLNFEPSISDRETDNWHIFP